MSTLMAILLLLGIALVLVEVIVPGGIVGTLGIVSMIGGVVLAFKVHGSMGGIVVLGIVAAVLAIGLFIEFRLLPRTSIGRSLFLSSAVTGSATLAPAEATLVGRTGETITALAPTGLVLIDGRKYESSSRSGFIDRGVTVVVRGSDNFRIIVEKS